MLMPVLSSWVEKSDFGVGLWIGGLSPRTFVSIAGRAGEPQILNRCLAADSKRDNVFHVQRNTDKNLRG